MQLYYSSPTSGKTSILKYAVGVKNDATSLESINSTISFLERMIYFDVFRFTFLKRYLL